MTFAVFSPELARKIKRFVQSEVRRTQSRPVPQRMRRHPRGGGGSPVRRGVTTSAVTNASAEDESGTVQVQLKKPDPDNAGKWINKGDPVTVEVWGDVPGTTEPGVKVVVEKDEFGLDVIVTYPNCEEEEA